MLCSVEQGAQPRAWRGTVSAWTSPRSSGRKFLPEICVKKGQFCPSRTRNIRGNPNQGFANGGWSQTRQSALNQADKAPFGGIFVLPLRLLGAENFVPISAQKDPDGPEKAPKRPDFPGRIFARFSLKTLLTFSLSVGEDFWVFPSFLSERNVFFRPSDKCAENTAIAGQKRGERERERGRKTQKSSLISKEKVGKEFGA